MNKIGMVLTSANFQQKINEIQRIAEDDLKQAIEERIYSQPESHWYKRTYTLLHSVASTDLRIINNGTNFRISFKVVFDNNILKHYTIFGSKKYGLPRPTSTNPTNEVPIGDLIIPFLNEGWSWSGYSSGLIDNWSFRKPERFLELAIDKIKEDLIRRISNVLTVEVKKIGYK